MKSLASDFDLEWPVLEAIRQRDPSALAELIQRQGRWVRGVIYGATGRRDEVDDIAQQVWMTVWREIDQLEDPRRWRGWLYRITRNAALDAQRSKVRKKRLMKEVRQEAETSLHASPMRPDQALQQRERLDKMRDAIEALPEIYREPFVLRHLENWSYQQIGELMGLKSDTVETRLRRARQKLRETLSRQV